MDENKNTRVNNDRSPMMPTILDLPSELIANAVSFLPSDSDIFATRLSNKYLERSSLSHFGKQYFRKKGYMLTTPSLDVLQFISTHDDLRKYVQHIWFNPDCFTFVRPDCAPDPQETPDPENPESLLDLLSPSDRKKYEAYRECMKDHTSLISDSAGRLQAKLAVILSNLPNLETVGMRRSEDHSPWGWSRLRDAVGEDPRVLGPIPSGPMRSVSSPTRLFMAVITAVAAAGVKLRRLYTDAIEIDSIPAQALTEEQLHAVCASIWYLEINATRAHLLWKEDPQTSASTYGEGLVRLLKATTQLKEIGLQIFPDRKQSHLIAPSYRDPESWRGSYPYLCLQRIVDSVRLEHLTRVKLEKVTTSPGILLSFLSPCKVNMTSLKIRDVRLLSDEHESRPWQSIFTFLHRSCPNLEYLLFYHLMYETGGVSFVEDPPMPLPPSETDPTTGAPNPPYGEPAGGELFSRYEHIALETKGVGEVSRRVGEVVERHWYHQPMFSYAMDDGLWHTDTSDEEE